MHQCHDSYFFGHPSAYGVPRPGVRSEPELHHCKVLNPLCQARDWTPVPVFPRMALIPLCHSRNSTPWHLWSRLNKEKNPSFRKVELEWKLGITTPSSTLPSEYSVPPFLCPLVSLLRLTKVTHSSYSPEPAWSPFESIHKSSLYFLDLPVLSLNSFCNRKLGSGNNSWIWTFLNALNGTNSLEWWSLFF